MVPGKKKGEEVVGDNLFIHLMNIYLLLLLQDIGRMVNSPCFMCKNFNFKAMENFV